MRDELRKILEERIDGLPDIYRTVFVQRAVQELSVEEVAHALQIPERAGALRVVTRRLVRVAHAAGTEVHLWTINERADMDRLLALGVDGLVTDRADLALAAIAAHRGS